jgi:hypothetical protein
MIKTKEFINNALKTNFKKYIQVEVIYFVWLGMIYLLVFSH